MRTFLLLILIAVLAVLLWAVWTKTFLNSGVFILGLAATGLCGYLIADYIFNNYKKKLAAEIDLFKKENIGIKEEYDILQRQLAATVPQAEIEDLKKQLQHAEDEKRRINSEFLVQAATISSLNTRLEKLQSEYNEAVEDSTISSESRISEIEAIRDTLAITKAKLSELAHENESLKDELERFKNTPNNPQGIPDDLKMVEGIGVKIEGLLHNQGINTWKALSQTSVENLRDILMAAGKRYEIHDPTTWPEQARLLSNGDWEGFYEYIHDLRLARITPEASDIIVIEPLKIEASVAEVPEIAEKVIEPVALTPSVGNVVLIENTEFDEVKFLNENNDETAVLKPHRSRLVSVKEEDIEVKELPQVVEIQSIKEEIATPVETPVIVADTLDLSLDIEPQKEQAAASENQLAQPTQANDGYFHFGAADDLKIIEGIGPKIEILLKEAGIANWKQLAECSIERLRSILDKAGSRYRLNDPTTWPEQARLLDNGEWSKFQEFNEIR